MSWLAQFEGDWRLDRRIEDARAGVTGRLTGRASWQPGQGGLVLTEEGSLRYGDTPPMQALRRYIWREEAAGIAVFFEEGRPFHWFSRDCPHASHDCPPDLYKVTYDFTDWPRWRCRWVVRGPRKDYVMESAYSRN